jgi:hypothetical protein
MINELFDTEDLKSKFEIPYLSDKRKFIKSFKDIGVDAKKTPEGDFLWKLLYEFPELDQFEQIVDDKFIALFVKSVIPYEKDGKIHYCQLGLHKTKGGEFIVNTIFKDVEDENSRNWFIREWGSDKMSDLYPVIDWFIKTCNILNCQIKDLKFIKN